MKTGNNLGRDAGPSQSILSDSAALTRRDGPVSVSEIPEGICRCGCGGKTTLYKGKYRKYIHTHHTRRFTESSYTVLANGCWEWQGTKLSTGYGRYHLDGQCIQAHNYIYELHIGPIPDGLELDHLCSNRICVNPEHLEPVTRAENIRRCSATKLCKSDVALIRTMWANREKNQRELGEMFGVTQSNIWMIINNLRWKEDAA